MSVQRLALAITLSLCCATTLAGATLIRLSMADMASKSTDVVRGRVHGSSAKVRQAPGRGSMIYTHYSIEVLERWKGNAASVMDVAVPGGLVNGVRQTFFGTPVLEDNAEYVFFLWTSRSGLTQVIGLSQGLFDVKFDASGNPTVTRGAATEPMFDSSGQRVSDSATRTSLAAFRHNMQRFGLVSGK